MQWSFMSKIDDLTRFKHIRDAAMIAISFVKNRSREDLDKEQMLSLALVRLIEIIGEAANHISTKSQETYSHIPWREIVGMRNRIIHAYFDVDLDIVLQVVIIQLPVLIKFVDRAIQELERED